MAAAVLTDSNVYWWDLDLDELWLDKQISCHSPMSTHRQTVMWTCPHLTAHTHTALEKKRIHGYFLKRHGCTPTHTASGKPTLTMSLLIFCGIKCVCVCLLHLLLIFPPSISIPPSSCCDPNQPQPPCVSIIPSTSASVQSPSFFLPVSVLPRWHSYLLGDGSAPPRPFAKFGVLCLVNFCWTNFPPLRLRPQPSIHNTYQILVINYYQTSNSW